MKCQAVPVTDIPPNEPEHFDSFQSNLSRNTCLAAVGSVLVDCVAAIYRDPEEVEKLTSAAVSSVYNDLFYCHDDPEVPPAIEQFNINDLIQRLKFGYARLKPKATPATPATPVTVLEPLKIVKGFNIKTNGFPRTFSDQHTAN